MAGEIMAQAQLNSGVGRGESRRDRSSRCADAAPPMHQTSEARTEQTA